MKEALFTFEMLAMVFLGGFIIGAFVESRAQKKNEAQFQAGHLANISTAMWSIMNEGVKVKKVVKIVKKNKSLLPRDEKGKMFDTSKVPLKNGSYDMLEQAGVKKEYQGTVWS